MKIIIVGCGKVGITLAEQLTKEKHYVTVIDALRGTVFARMYCLMPELILLIY